MRQLILAVALLPALLALPNLAHAQEVDKIYNRIMEKRTIRCGYAEWTPFFNIDPKTNKLSGLFYDLYEKMGKKLDLKIEWTQSVGWGEIMAALNSNKIDMFCIGIWPDAGRINNLTLSRAILYNPSYLWARADDKRFDNNYALLNNPKYTVIGQDGDITASVLEREFPKAKTMHIAPIAQQGEMIQNVVNKKGDVTLLDIPYAEDFMAKNPNKLRRVEGAPMAIFPVVMPLARGEYQLKSMMDTVITDFINDGTIEQLIKKHGAKDTYAPQPDVIIPTQK